jgi:uncharacterized membrane protein YphA (DoxX/SURF4 family)
VGAPQLDGISARIRPIATGGMALTLAYLGVLNLVYGDTLLQWQPAPDGALWHATLGYASGVILILAGAGIAVPRFRHAAATVGAIWLAAGAMFLHLPDVVAKHADVGSLLGLAENSATALGVATLALPDRWARAIRIGFGLCCILFGISHFAYASITADMVPAWLPERLALAYLTGAIHFATGVCLVLGIAPRIAALVEALMMSSFVILVHIPRVAAAPNNRFELTMLGMAALLTVSAWLVATLAGAKRSESVARDTGVEQHA